MGYCEGHLIPLSWTFVWYASLIQFEPEEIWSLLLRDGYLYCPNLFLYR